MSEATCAAFQNIYNNTNGDINYLKLVSVVIGNIKLYVYNAKVCWTVWLHSGEEWLMSLQRIHSFWVMIS